MNKAIRIQLYGTGLTTADLGWFVDAIKGASGHSGKDYPVSMNNNSISADVETDDE